MPNGSPATSIGVCVTSPSNSLALSTMRCPCTKWPVRVDPDVFGLCVRGIDGRSTWAGTLPYPGRVGIYADGSEDVAYQADAAKRVGAVGRHYEGLAELRQLAWF